MENSKMMEVISTRRSVRKYEARPVEEDKLELCLEAARLAPSACNSQPWKYIAVTDPEILGRLGEGAFSGVYTVTGFAKKAPVLVAVVSEKSGIPAWLGGKFRSLPFYLVDIGISVQNFVLTAHEQGLGTCILGWFDEDKAAKTLGVPSGRKVELLISVGYPAESPAPRPRKEREKVISHNRY